MIKFTIVLIIVFLSKISLANTRYANGIDCYCDSIIKVYSTTGALQKEIPYSNGYISGNIYEYDQNLDVVKAYNYEQNNISTIMPTQNNHIDSTEKINAKFAIIIGSGYYSAVHYAGIEFGVGYLSKIIQSDNYGFGGFLTLLFAGGCTDDGYDKNGISTDDFNKKGDLGYSTCYEGAGIGLRSGLNRRIGNATILFYSGALIYSSEKKIQNEDTILGYYTGDSGQKSKMNFVLPIGLNYQSSSIFGASIEFKTDLSFGATANLAMDMY